MKPVARRDGLLTRDLKDELLVYARDEHRAHCLNHTAATVFKNADGTRTVADLARLVAPEADRTASEAVVSRRPSPAWPRQGSSKASPAATGWSRRDVVRRVGIGAAILLPAVASIVAPTPAEAAATCATTCASKPDGTPCTCFSANPCTATCVTGACSDGGSC